MHKQLHSASHHIDYASLVHILLTNLQESVCIFCQAHWLVDDTEWSFYAQCQTPVAELGLGLPGRGPRQRDSSMIFIIIIIIIAVNDIHTVVNDILIAY